MKMNMNCLIYSLHPHRLAAVALVPLTQKMDIEWKCPLMSNAPLISTMVQSGIKLFLHQRNQIPLPVEQLAKKLPFATTTTLQNDQMDNHVEMDTSSESSQDEPRHRIQSIIAKRKRDQIHQKKKKAQNKLSRQEELVLKSITESLEVLDSVLISHQADISTVGLFFGSSIPSAKEVVLFHLPALSSTPEIPLADDAVSTLTRNFYKSIIMTEEFCDFTAKNLHATRIHISIFTRNELATDGLSLMELDERHFLRQLFCRRQLDLSMEMTEGESLEEDHIPQSSKSKRKVLQIHMRNNNAVAECCIGSDLFSYQIPLRIKGITCKKNVW